MQLKDNKTYTVYLDCCFRTNLRFWENWIHTTGLWIVFSGEGLHHGAEGYHIDLLKIWRLRLHGFTNAVGAFRIIIW